VNIVRVLPLKSLSSPSVPMGAERKRDLSKSNISNLLRQSRVVQFIVVDVGQVPMEIPKDECHRFWKEDVKSHVADSARIELGEFEGGYCYFASEWGLDREGVPLVVLEKQH